MRTCTFLVVLMHLANATPTTLWAISWTQIIHTSRFNGWRKFTFCRSSPWSCSSCFSKSIDSLHWLLLSAVFWSMAVSQFFTHMRSLGTNMSTSGFESLRTRPRMTLSVPYATSDMASATTFWLFGLGWWASNFRTYSEKDLKKRFSSKRIPMK